MSLRSHHLSRRDGAVTRVNSVSLDFPAGQLCAIVGPNGSGKSSLLQLLSGEIQASQGRVSLDGIDLRHWHAKALARRRAVLPQAIPARLPFRVKDVVALGLAPHELEPHSDILDDTLQQVDLLNYRTTPYSQLSGGQQARVHLARTLAQLHAAKSTAIYLLDEPTASLDPHWQHRCLQLLEQRATQGWSVVCVLHDLNLASRYANRIVLMNHGQVALDGSSHEVLQSTQIDRVYRLEFERLQRNRQTYLHAV